MTKQFCDVCGKEIYGDNKFSVYISQFNLKPQEFDVCGTCQTEFKEGGKQSDIDIYNKIRSGK